MNTIIMFLFVSLSILDFLALDQAEFFITLVSWPAYTIIPKTQSVFLKLDPLKRKLSIPITYVSFATASILNVPSNQQILSFGWLHFISPCKLLNNSVLMGVSTLLVTKALFRCLRATLCFRLVSPSRFLVSIQHIPLTPDVAINTRSAGRNYSFYTLMIQPHFKSRHYTFLNSLAW